MALLGGFFSGSLCVENRFPLPKLGFGGRRGMVVKAGGDLTCMCDTVADMTFMSGLSDGSHMVSWFSVSLPSLPR